MKVRISWMGLFLALALHNSAGPAESGFKRTLPEFYIPGKQMTVYLYPEIGYFQADIYEIIPEGWRFEGAYLQAGFDQDTNTVRWPFLFWNDIKFSGLRYYPRPSLDQRRREIGEGGLS